MPLPENFIDGQVLDAANVNDITETVNQIDARVNNLEVIPIVDLFEPGVTTHILQLSDTGKILRLLDDMENVFFPASAQADFPFGSQVTILNVTGATVNLLSGQNVFFKAITTPDVGQNVQEIGVPSGGIVTCVRLPVLTPVFSIWYVTGNIV